MTTEGTNEPTPIWHPIHYFPPTTSDFPIRVADCINSDYVISKPTRKFKKALILWIHEPRQTLKSGIKFNKALTP